MRISRFSGRGRVLSVLSIFAMMAWMPLASATPVGGATGGPAANCAAGAFTAAFNAATGPGGDGLIVFNCNNGGGYTELMGAANNGFRYSVNGNLTISFDPNNTANIVIDAQNMSRVFYIAAGASLTINMNSGQNLTLQNGNAGFVAPPAVQGNGGNIANDGTLTVNRTGAGTLIIANANNGNAPPPANGNLIMAANTGAVNGAGLFNTGTANLDGVVVRGNVAVNNGGGIHNAAGGTLTLTGSDVGATMALALGATSNGASVGGGIYNLGTLVVERSFVGFNFADNHGGGIANGTSVFGPTGVAVPGGTLTVVDSLIGGNSDNGNGGFGGGLALTGPSTNTITRSSIVVNTTGFNAGGMTIFDGTLNLSNSTISSNNGGGFDGGLQITNTAPGTTTTATLRNNTLAFNNAPGASAANLSFQDFAGTINADIRNTLVSNPAGGGTNCMVAGGGNVNISGAGVASNLDSDGSCMAIAGNAAGFTQGAAMLAALGNNGGPMVGTVTPNNSGLQSHLLNAGSVAIDTGSNADCLAGDERGGPRPDDGDNNGSVLCDIGAIEIMGNDPDGDGVSDAVETATGVAGAAGANNLTALPAPTGTGNIVVSTNGGPALTNVLVRAPAAAPAGLAFPDGLVGFTIAAPAANQQVSLTLPTAPAQHFKFNETTATVGQTPLGFTRADVPFGGAANPIAVIAGNVVTLTLNNGAFGDTDAAASITDPSGGAVAAPAGGGNMPLVPNFTGSGGGCALAGLQRIDPLLPLLLALAGLFALRRRYRA